MNIIGTYLGQIKYWQQTIHQQEKAIRRKNKQINSLQRQVSDLNIRCADTTLMVAAVVSHNDGILERAKKLKYLRGLEQVYIRGYNKAIDDLIEIIEKEI